MSFSLDHEQESLLEMEMFWPFCPCFHRANNSTYNSDLGYKCDVTTSVTVVTAFNSWLNQTVPSDHSHQSNQTALFWSHICFPTLYKNSIHVQCTWSVTGRQKGWRFMTGHNDPQTRQIHVNRWKKCNNIPCTKIMTPQTFKCGGWCLKANMSWSDKWWWVVAMSHEPSPVWQPVTDYIYWRNLKNRDLANNATHLEASWPVLFFLSQVFVFFFHKLRQIVSWELNRLKHPIKLLLGSIKKAIYEIETCTLFL